MALSSPAPFRLYNSIKSRFSTKGRGGKIHESTHHICHRRLRRPRQHSHFPAIPVNRSQCGRSRKKNVSFHDPEYAQQKNSQIHLFFWHQRGKSDICTMLLHFIQFLFPERSVFLGQKWPDPHHLRLYFMYIQQILCQRLKSLKRGTHHKTTTWLSLFILGVSALFFCPYPGLFFSLTTNRLLLFLSALFRYPCRFFLSCLASF